MKKILFIINPFSGIGKQKIVEQLIENKLDKTLFVSKLIYTEYAGHAIKISKKQKENFDIIVAVGGDGSVNEVSRKLIGTNIILGVIPAGSGNGFARHFNLPLQPEKAIEVINRLNIKTIDTVKINKLKFLNIAGIGFDAEMGYKFAHLEQRGLQGYSKVILNSLSHLTSSQRTIKINNQKIVKDAFIISIANASQYGYNAIISPSSKPDDGLIEVTIIDKISLFDVPFIAMQLFSGRIDKNKHATIFQTTKLKILNKGEIMAHIDGEPIILTDNIKIKIIPNSLRVIVP